MDIDVRKVTTTESWSGFQTFHPRTWVIPLIGPPNANIVFLVDDQCMAYEKASPLYHSDDLPSYLLAGY